MESDSGGHHSPEKDTYVLTFDLGQKIKLLRSVGLKTPDPNDPIFTNISAELTKRIADIFPDATVHGVSMDTLADEILSSAMEHSDLKDAAIVSTCVELSAPRRGHTLEINRLVNPAGEIIGLGSRPGHTCLDDQIRSISTACPDQSLILMEDGTFTGSTLLYLLKKFATNNTPVATVVVGFAFSEAMKNLEKEFDGEVIVVEEMGNFIDWMPDHDFFPFAPNCGRVIGTSLNGHNLPLYTHNHASYSVPYLLPFCPMPDWTSIPESYTVEFSRYCLGQCLAIFQQIDRLNGHHITIGELINIFPRVSVPVSVNQKNLPHLDSRVTSFLHDLCHEL